MRKKDEGEVQFADTSFNVLDLLQTLTKDLPEELIETPVFFHSKENVLHGINSIAVIRSEDGALIVVLSEKYDTDENLPQSIQNPKSGQTIN